MIRICFLYSNYWFTCLGNCMVFLLFSVWTVFDEMNVKRKFSFYCGGLWETSVKIKNHVPKTQDFFQIYGLIFKENILETKREDDAVGNISALIIHFSYRKLIFLCIKLILKDLWVTKILKNKRIVYRMYIDTRCVQKLSELNLYLPKLKWTLKETLIFFKIVFFRFTILIPLNFPLFKGSLKLLFKYGVKLCCYISFNVPYVPMNFQFRKRESHMELGLLDMKGAAL